jgi:hypothetical protein
MGGGPDFFGYPDRPFWTNADRDFLYLPVAQSLAGPLSAAIVGGLDRFLFAPLAIHTLLRNVPSASTGQQ